MALSSSTTRRLDGPTSTAHLRRRLLPPLMGVWSLLMDQASSPSSCLRRTTPTSRCVSAGRDLRVHVQKTDLGPLFSASTEERTRAPTLRMPSTITSSLRTDPRSPRPPATSRSSTQTILPTRRPRSLPATPTLIPRMALLLLRTRTVIRPRHRRPRLLLSRRTLRVVVSSSTRIRRAPSPEPTTRSSTSLPRADASSFDSNSHLLLRRTTSP